MKIKTDILINEKLWKKIPNISKKLKQLVKEIIPQTPLAPLFDIPYITIEVSILLTNDAYIQELNKNYRGKDKPTNVLSFPLNDVSKMPNGKSKALPNPSLGDVAISYQTLEKEALEQNKSFENHLTHLLLHSILHLIGFDHEKNEKDAKMMEDLEVKILKNLGIKNPYEII